MYCYSLQQYTFLAFCNGFDTHCGMYTYEGREGGLPIPFPSHHFFPNPTNQCPDPTDMLTKHQSHSHFGFFFLIQIPVPATEIPFSQCKNRLIPVPILPLHDPHIQLFQFMLSDQSLKPTRQDRRGIWDLNQ